MKELALVTGIGKIIIGYKLIVPPNHLLKSIRNKLSYNIVTLK